MTIPVIGMCRFSFAGYGDWVRYRNNTLDVSAEEVRKKVAAELYDETRLELRFFTFENLLLKSLEAQTRQDFLMLVLTSDLMPKKFQDRLRDICNPYPQIKVIVSDAPDVNSAFVPEIQSIREDYGKIPMQFRVDDDDCVSQHYIERLRDVTERMDTYGDMGRFSYSQPNTLIVTSYSNAQPEHYKHKIPFHSAGCAARIIAKDRSVYSFGHFDLGRQFPSFLDTQGYGSLMTKFDGHDSIDNVGFKAAKKITGKPFFKATLKKEFPFVDPGIFKEIEQYVSAMKK